MSSFSILLAEIMVDPEEPVDISKLPADAVVERVRELYAFLPQPIEVEIG